MVKDICYCGDECDNTECERNKSNITPKAIVTMAFLKGTEYCPLEEENDNTTKSN